MTHEYTFERKRVNEEKVREIRENQERICQMCQRPAIEHRVQVRTESFKVLKSDILFLFKPVHNENKMVAVIDRWLLFRGTFMWNPKKCPLKPGSR